MPEKLIITRSVNGWILDPPCGDWEYEEGEQEVVENTPEEGFDGIIKLLELVAKWAGYPYDKFSKTNLRVSFDKPGHKVED